MRVTSVILDDDRSLETTETQALAACEGMRDRIEEHLTRQTTHAKWISAGGATLIGLGVATFALVDQIIGLAIGGIGLLGTAAGLAFVRTRELDATVQSIEKGYWTGYLIPDRRGTVIFDATESIDQTEFTLELLTDPAHVETIEQRLASLREYPIVMTPDADIEEEFLGTLTEVENAIEEAESRRINAPIVTETHPAVESVDRLLEAADSEPIATGGVTLSPNEATTHVKAINAFETMADEDHGESVLREVRQRSREIETDLSELQETATELLNKHVETAGETFGRISYHFYCPDCLADDVESRLELLDGESGRYCPTCRSNFDHGVGVPRHRIRDDIVLDIHDQLWIEKDDQRREIYESIEDQKAELEEREFEQRREEIRNVDERVRDIQAEIRDLETESEAKKEATLRTILIMDKYDRLRQQQVERFRRDVTEAFEEIDEMAGRAIERTESVVSDRIEQAREEAAEKAEALREEERKRQRERIAYEQAQADHRTEKALEAIQAMHQNAPERRGE